MLSYLGWFAEIQYKWPEDNKNANTEDRADVIDMGKGKKRERIGESKRDGDR